MKKRQLPLNTAEDLYAASVIVPATGVIYEGILLHMYKTIKTPLSPLGWAAYWRDLVLYQQGFAVLRLLLELTEDESVWRTDKVPLAFSQLIDWVEEGAHKAYLKHYNSPEDSLKYISYFLLDKISETSLAHNNYAEEIITEIANMAEKEMGVYSCG